MSIFTISHWLSFIILKALLKITRKIIVSYIYIIIKCVHKTRTKQNQDKEGTKQEQEQKDQVIQICILESHTIKGPDVGSFCTYHKRYCIFARRWHIFSMKYCIFTRKSCMHPGKNSNDHITALQRTTP